MQRTAVNPSSWSVQLGFDQAELVEGHRCEFICSAQGAVDVTGTSQHPGVMAAQLGFALDNLDAVAAGAGMTLANVARLNVYTTDMDTLLPHFPVVNERLTGTGVRFATTCSASPASPGPRLERSCTPGEHHAIRTLV
jgi:enamine deaminase RidA (YjgF/YER057c/UK114 family)